MFITHKKKQVSNNNLCDEEEFRNKKIFILYWISIALISNNINRAAQYASLKICFPGEK